MGVDIPSDPAPNGYVSNPYQDSIDKALAYIRAEKEGTDGWENIDTKDGIILEKKYENDGSAIPLVRGHGLIKSLSAPALLSAILQPSARHLWDARFESGALLERYGRRTYKFYSVQKGVGWVVSERDIVGVQHVQEGENGAFELIQTSVDGPPGDKGRVRATLTAGWSAVPRGDDLEVSYVVKINPNGSIPSAIVGKIVQDIPLSVVNITNFIRDKGVPPYITNKELSSQLRTDIVNIEEKKHVANLIAGGQDEQVTFAVDPKVFGGNWKVEVNGNGVSAEKSGDNAVVKVPANAGQYQVIISAA
ncbi:unnamed protein product [Rhizoctonia solani]|uniref:START domain-containing protein n=1 Tax=Rhizoctonia solani TaxID=456999 RepID=A0A8H3H5C1_9AGAM|nr:unnamed protein product [Rhizoctonia solani]